MTIGNKRQMYAMFEAGEFGNKTRSWAVVDDYLANDFPGLVALRYMERPGGPCIYGLKREAIPEYIESWIKQGCKREYIHISETLDPNNIRLAGEVQRTENYLDLHYYDKPGHHMRNGLRYYGKNTSGLMALGLLHKYMDAPSSDQLHHLLDTYSGHVVEFTCCESSVGELRYNTIFWEVRAY